MKIEKAIFRPSFDHATPRGVADFFAEIFAALDERPRKIAVEIDLSESFIREPILLDFEKGEPVFRQHGSDAAHGKLRGRWLAEHEAPLLFSLRTTKCLLEPTDANRVKVRFATSWLSRFINGFCTTTAQ